MMNPLDGLQLSGSSNCRCGRTHEIPVRLFCYKDSALDTVPEVFTDVITEYNSSRYVVVADARTWQICGQRIAERLNGKSIIVPDSTDTGPVCDDSTCLWLKQQISTFQPSALFAAGSGTINDLCKWAAFELNLPYAVAATAASMNGYAAANVAAKIKGVKVIQRAAAPVAVLAEPSVIEQAPAEMTAAGFADTIAKHFSKVDWLLNNFLFGEYYCNYCADLLNGIEGSYIETPEKLRARDPKTIQGLFEALFLTGISMTMVGTSIPASGGEHLLSHVLDMTADINNQGHCLHGLQVGLGTIVSAALYERILAIKEPKIQKMPENIDTSYWQKEGLIESIKAQYTSKQGSIKTAAAVIAHQQIWEQLRNKLRPIVMSPLKTKDLLNRAGAADSIKALGLSRQRIEQALLHTHEIRSRFTVIDLAWLMGVLPAVFDDIIDTYLT
jgi:glycerol-1-phosphate dehydrogenase [NAD(P)+]